MQRALPFLLAALAMVAAAVAVDLVLLGYVGNSNDPVGSLSPVLPAGMATQTVTVPAPAPAPTPPRRGEGGGSDD